MKVIRKRCTCCRKLKPVTEFHRNKGNRDGLATQCKKCLNEKNAARYAGQPYDRDRRYDQRSRARYGVGKEHYDELFKKQDGLCAICQKPSSKGRLHIDHDHESGDLRDLLCGTCNNWLGILEQTKFVANALAYLGKHESPSLSRLRTLLETRK